MTAPADQVFFGGRFYTMAPDLPVAEAVAVRGGRIVAVGARSRVLDLRSTGTELVDLGGTTVLPGFIETHMHPIFYGIQEQQIVIPEASRSIPEVVDLIRRRLSSLDPGEPALVWRYDQAAMAENRHLEAADLDPLGDEHPIVVRNVSGHLAYVNRRVLRDRGIDADTADPPGGEIVRDAAGNPTGQFNELSAMELVTGILPNLDDPGNRRALDLAQETMLASGVTSVHDMGVWSDDYYAAYASSADSGELRVRARLYVFTPDLDASPVPADLAGDQLTFGGVKFAVDGMLLGETAMLRDPYSVSGGTGVPLQSPEDLGAAVFEAHRRGHQVAIHAEGDGALDIALDAIENALTRLPRPDHRHRVEHVEVIHPDQVARMARLGVTASMLLNGVRRWGDHLHAELGPERIGLVSPLRSLQRAAIPTALHSDCPISPVEPLRSMQTSMDRLTRNGVRVGPGEAVSIDGAVRALTADAAYLGFEDDLKGSIEEGKLADFAVLDRDPFDADGDGPSHASVIRTIVGGATAWMA